MESLSSISGLANALRRGSFLSVIDLECERSDWNFVRRFVAFAFLPLSCLCPVLIYLLALVLMRTLNREEARGWVTMGLFLVAFLIARILVTKNVFQSFVDHWPQHHSLTSVPKLIAAYIKGTRHRFRGEGFCGVYVWYSPKNTD